MEGTDLDDSAREALGWLETPLYWLWHLADVDKGLPTETLRDICAHWPKEKITATTRALAWAVDHPEIDLAFLPGLGYSNEQLHRYLTVLFHQFSCRTRQ